MNDTIINRKGMFNSGLAIRTDHSVLIGLRIPLSAEGIPWKSDCPCIHPQLCGSTLSLVLLLYYFNFLFGNFYLLSLIIACVFQSWSIMHKDQLYWWNMRNKIQHTTIQRLNMGSTNVKSHYLVWGYEF